MAKRLHVCAWGRTDLRNLDYATDKYPAPWIFEEYPFVSIWRREREETINVALNEELRHAQQASAECVNG